MIYELPVNPPGMYYGMAYWLCAIVMLLVQPKRNRLEGGKRFLYCLIGLVVIQGFMFHTQGANNLLFALSILMILFMIFIFLRGATDFSLREAGYYTIRSFIHGEFGASLSWQLYYYLATSGKITHKPVYEAIHLIICMSIYFFSQYFTEKRMHKGIDELHLTNRHLFISAMIVFTAYVVSNLSYVPFDNLFSSHVVMDIYIIHTMVDLAGMSILYGFHSQVKEMQTRFEYDTLQGIMQMQYQSYKLSEESINIVNQKYHDLKHQLILLREGVMNSDNTSEMGEKEKEIRISYLDQMAQEIKIYETRIKTGNKVLDAVLTSKSLLCQKKKIEFKYMVDGEKLSFMGDMEISALFGNMLDNAIESVEKQKDPEKRLIYLNLQMEEDKPFLRIKMENYCDEKLQFRRGLPQTTKKDENLHGFGMKSISSTVEKYGGSVIASQKNNWFRLHIILPTNDPGIYEV